MRMNTLNQRQFYLAVSGIVVVSFVLSLWINRHTWFLGDDFAILTDRYFAAVDENWSRALLLPHNDHLVYMLPAIFMYVAILFAIAIILRFRTMRSEACRGHSKRSHTSGAPLPSSLSCACLVGTRNPFSQKQS